MFKPAYLKLYELNQQEFQHRVKLAYDILTGCILCPFDCKVNRLKDEKGVCKTGALAPVYSYFCHHGEEPPISGENGSGTIFFANCNMHCVYCQNYEFSQNEQGKETDPDALSNIMIELQERGAHNINFVSPSHVAAQVLKAIYLAIPKGLKIPLIYNSGGYDHVKTLGLFDGIIDVYLPDMRYDDQAIAKKFSGAKDYPKFNRLAIKEMWRQVGMCKFDQNNIIERGLIIRHLVLPNNLSGTAGVMHFISNEVSKQAYIGLMSQYFPCFKAENEPLLARRITKGEYDLARQEMAQNGLKNGWIQEDQGLIRFAGVNIKPNIPAE